MVPRALQAAQKLEREHGLRSRSIDLRTLNPFDWEAIAASVKKTSRAIVAYEDTLSWGYGAEIAARIADELFEYLDAPVRRVAAMDTFVAYQPLTGKRHPAAGARPIPRHERSGRILEKFNICHSERR